jgi:hypothetical protein
MLWGHSVAAGRCRRGLGRYCVLAQESVYKQQKSTVQDRAKEMIVAWQSRDYSSQ